MSRSNKKKQAKKQPEATISITKNAEGHSVAKVWIKGEWKFGSSGLTTDEAKAEAIRWCKREGLDCPENLDCREQIR